MRKKLTGILISFLCSCLISQASKREWVATVGSEITSAKVEVLSSDIKSSVLKFSVDGFFKTPVVTPHGTAFIIELGNTTPLLEAGAPDLPKLTASIIIPDLEGMRVTVSEAVFTDYPSIDIAPSKGNLKRDRLPADIRYQYGDVYQQNQFWPLKQAFLRKPYILRDFRGQTIVVQPFQYNPVTKILRVYSSMTVTVTIDKTIGENMFSRVHSLRNVNEEFAAIYNHHFKNWLSVQYNPVSENGNLLIICHSPWMNLMQPFVKWKIQKGIPTDIVDVSQIGNNFTAIKNYIVNYYNSHPLTHVLLVGDYNYVATPLPAGLGGASDPSYGYISGNDSYSEVFVGRFSAESAADVQTQVDRVISYEQFPDTNINWFDKGVCIGSNQGPGDDNEMDWEHEANIRTELLAFTYSSMSELYDGTHPSTTDAPGDPISSDLFNLLQSGTSIINYTGHGSSSGFNTTGFSNSDVTFLTNDYALPFIWSVGCVNGNFNTIGTPCFGEALLRAQNNGHPTGAIATMMSSINQSWSPPMDAQDEMNAILSESYSNNIKRTFGGISFNGCMHMNDQYAVAGAEMTDSWHCFGDPTLNVRTAFPQTMTVNHAGNVPIGTTSLIVNCNFNGGYVALTLNGHLIGTGTVNSGFANVSFNPVITMDTIIVTVTGFNQIPYVGTVIIIPTSGPYVIYNTSLPHEIIGNNDGQVDFGEQISADVTLQNIGLSNANALTFTVTTNDLFVLINSVNSVLTNITAGSTTTLNDLFVYTVSANIPDQHEVVFNISVTDNLNNTWISTFKQIINAPQLKLGLLAIDDVVGGNGNGILEPGETGNVIIECRNEGHSDAPLASTMLSSLNPFVTINSGSVNLGLLSKQSVKPASFNLSLASSTVPGTLYDMTCNFISGAYSYNHIYMSAAGVVEEDFESGNFNLNNWTVTGAQPWFFSNFQPFDGSFCAQSGNINDNETSVISMNTNVLVADSLSFMYRVSSEQGWDYLRLYIDGIQQNEWSGIAGWNYSGVVLSAGLHTITFSYEKDNVNSVGMDCAWLDNIKFPPMSAVVNVSNLLYPRVEIGYPNPADDEFNLLLQSTIENISAQLIDAQGNYVPSIVCHTLENDKKTLVISTKHLSSGIYFLQLNNGKKQMMNKIIVQH